MTKGHDKICTVAKGVMEVRQTFSDNERSLGWGFLLNQLCYGVRGVTANLNGPSLMHEVAGVSQNTLGMAVAERTATLDSQM